MLEPGFPPSHYGFRIWLNFMLGAVRGAGFYEVCSRPVSLLTFRKQCSRLESRLPLNRSGADSGVARAVARSSFNFSLGRYPSIDPIINRLKLKMPFEIGVDPLCRFAPDHSLPVTSSQGKGDANLLAVVTGECGFGRSPSLVSRFNRPCTAIVACIGRPAAVLAMQQIAALHGVVIQFVISRPTSAIDALVVHHASEETILGAGKIGSLASMPTKATFDHVFFRRYGRIAAVSSNQAMSEAAIPASGIFLTKVGFSSEVQEQWYCTPLMALTRIPSPSDLFSKFKDVLRLSSIRSTCGSKQRVALMVVSNQMCLLQSIFI